jgi:hypothetical protein
MSEDAPIVAVIAGPNGARKSTAAPGLNVIDKPRKTVTELFDEGAPIDAALRRAVQDALRRHKLLGQTVVVWENGKIVRLRPADIPADDVIPRE